MNKAQRRDFTLAPAPPKLSFFSRAQRDERERKECVEAGIKKARLMPGFDCFKRILEF